jgi:TetR/AcrR family transcriptional regulator, repressor of fatR-cypB operon
MNVRYPDLPAKKAAILSAGLDLIAAQGFHKAPMSVLGQMAEVATGTIYYYFSSKEELIRELYFLTLERMERAISIPSDQGMMYKAQFEQAWKSLFSFFIDNPEEFSFVEQYSNLPLNQDESEESFGFFPPPLLELLEKGIRENELQNFSPRLLFSLFLGSVISTIKLHLEIKEELNEIDLNDALAFVWEGLRSKSNNL